MSRIITAELLYRKDACADQVALFEQLFPDGVEPTLELCLEYALVFDWNWAATHLLSSTARKTRDEAEASALEAYDEAVTSALEAYHKAEASAWQAYHKAEAPASKAYDEAVASAQEAYDEAVASARKTRDEAVVTAWFNAWKQDTQ